MQFIPANINRNRPQKREDWFEQRRDFFVRRVFRDFFTVLASFQDLCQLYTSCSRAENTNNVDLLSGNNEKQRDQIWGRLTNMVGTEMDKGPLWQLKDLCHRIWPNDGEYFDTDGALIDWFIGSIFHEAMKLKENIYILNSYGPSASRISPPAPASDSGREDLRSMGFAPQPAQCVDIKGMLQRIVVAVIDQMEQLAFLFGQTNYMLRIILPNLSANMLLVRLLIEQEEVVQDLWGETMEAVFDDMFYGAPAQGFCAAGRSYMSGQWYTQAFDMYQRAKRVDGGCSEAITKMYQLKAMIDQNSDLLGAA